MTPIDPTRCPACNRTYTDNDFHSRLFQGVCAACDPGVDHLEDTAPYDPTDTQPVGEWKDDDNHEQET